MCGIAQCRNQRDLFSPSPSDPIKSGHLIEVRVVGENRQSVLPCQRANPKIVLRTGLAGYAELVTVSA